MTGKQVSHKLLPTEIYLSLFEQAVDGIFIVDSSGKYLDVNPRGCEMTGYARDELLNLNMGKLSARADTDESGHGQRIFELEIGKSLLFEQKLRRKDGVIMDVETHASRLTNGYVLGIMRDITEKKQLQQQASDEVLRYQSIIHTSLDAFLSVDLSGNIVEINPACCKMVGYEPDELIGMNVATLDVNEDTCVVKQHVEKIVQQGRDQFQTTYQRKNGTRIEVEISASYLPTHNGRIVSFLRDISERVLNEKLLRRAQEQYEEMLNTVDGIVWEADALTFQFLFVSQQAMRLLGYPIENWLQQPNFWAEHIYIEDRENTVNHCVAATRAGQPHVMEYRMIAADGHLVWLRDIVSVHIENGYATKLRGVMVDIGDLKHAESVLQQSEEQFRAMFEEHSAVMLLISPENGQIIRANHAAERFYGYNTDELTQMTIYDINTMTREEILQEMAQVKTGTKKLFYFAHRLADGDIRNVEVFSSPISVDNRMVLFSIINDVTDRVQAQLAMEQSEERFRLAFDTTAISMAIATMDGRMEKVNDAMCSMFGYTMEEMTQKTFFEITHPEDLQQTKEIIRAIVTGEVPHGHLLKRYLHKDGHIVWGEISVVVIRDRDGQPQHLIGHIQDVTERHAAEIELVNSKKLYQDLVETAQDLIWQCDNEGRYTYLNPAWEKTMGYSISEMLGKPFFDFQVPEYAERDRQEFNVLRTGRTIQGYQTIHLNKLGEPVMLVFNAKAVHNLAGEMIGARGTAYDVTERQRAENVMAARLRLAQFASENRLGDLLQATIDEAEALTDSIIGFYHFVESDQHTLSLQAWSTNTLANMCKAQGRDLHYDVGQAGVWVECVHERKAVIHNNYEALPNRKGLPKGHARVLRELVVPVFRNDKIVAILGVGNKPREYDEEDIKIVSHLADLAWDIAERKRAEESLLESNKLLQDAQQVARLGYYQYNISAGFWTSSSLLDQIFDISNDYVRDVNGWLDIVHPGHRQEMGNYLRDHVLGKKLPFDKIYRIQRVGDKKTRWVHGLGTLEFDTNGNPTMLVGTIQDITEQHTVQEALRASEEKFFKAFQFSPMLISLSKVEDGTYLEVNGRFLEVSGFSRDEVIGKTSVEIGWISNDARIQLKEILLRDGHASNMEFSLHTKEKREIICRYHGQLINIDGKTRLLSIAEDITEQKKAESCLKTALAEKETLLRELYHRTKNNMQVISALLNLEAEKEQNARISAIFHEMESRIQSMALVHQMLYRSGNLSSIDLKEYVQELTGLLIQSFERDQANITLTLDTEPVEVLIDTAIPCGLVLNELVSNTFKHAFPGGRTGEVSIHVHRQEDDTIVLRVTDNGVGIPPDFDLRKASTLGLQTIYALGEYQLQGKVTFTTEKGVSCTVIFRDDIYQARV